MPKRKPGLVERGLARRYKGKLRLTPEGRRRLGELRQTYDHIPEATIGRFLQSLHGKTMRSVRRLPEVMTRNIAISGGRLSLARVETRSGRRAVVIKGILLPHTVPRRQYFFMRAVERAFLRAIQNRTLKPRYYSFRPVRYLAASGRFILSRYYPRPSLADIIYELDRTKLLEVMRRKRQSMKSIGENLRNRNVFKRIEAIVDLGRIANEEAKTTLKKILETSSSPLVRGFACYALALTGDLKMRKILNNVRLTDESGFVRWRAAVAMYMLRQVRRGAKDPSVLIPKNIIPSIFLANNPGITYSKLRQMFDEVKAHFAVVEPIARQSVKRYRGYKKFHIDMENPGNILVFGFDGKERFTIGLIDQG
ncbi:MAG: HEAT repeat domain-containing protein [Candidatus Diapherotrites archaeon]|nr:HEAT repeat domain-containing protein [Candidatus Diapherotrites archaeon]